MDIIACPECGTAAEVFDRTVLESTGGPLEYVRVRCVQRHLFFMPAVLLAPQTAGAGGSGRRLAEVRIPRQAL